MIKTAQLDPLAPKRDWHVRLLHEEPNKNLTIWLVDGQYVRERWDDDFIGGGHGYRYNFIPRKEVWIDNGTTDEEIIFYIIHELHERALMQGGASYKDAHKQARAVEVLCRAQPAKANEILAQEIEMQEDTWYLASAVTLIRGE